MGRSAKAWIAMTGVLLFMGAGCLSSDVSLVLDFINGWLQQRGVVDAQGNPTAKTVGYVATGGFLSTGDEGNDAIIGAGQAVKSIKAADSKLEAADQAMAKEPPDYGAALASVNEAEKLRPRDPHVQNKKAVVLLESGDVAGAKPYMSTYGSDCEGIAGIPMSQPYANRCYTRVQAEADAAVPPGSAAPGEPPRSCAQWRAYRDAHERLASLAVAAKLGDDEAARHDGGVVYGREKMAEMGCPE